MTSICARVRRARPLLGTLVECSLAGQDEASLHAAATAAFAEIALIHDLMTVHAKGSDVHRINNAALGTPVYVHQHTWRVLELALAISRDSGGVFDVAVGGEMMSRGVVPALVAEPSEAGASFRDIELLPGNGVRVLRRLALDLGGIAKGYAVDCATRILRDAGVASGCINAGGDLRVFGNEPVSVQVRDPLDPRIPRAQVELSNTAFATSASYGKDCGMPVSGMVFDPRSHASVASGRSASVRAPDCAVADALAKCALLTGEDSEQLLRSYQANGFVLDGNVSFVIGTGTTLDGNNGDLDTDEGKPGSVTAADVVSRKSGESSTMISGVGE